MEDSSHFILHTTHSTKFHVFADESMGKYLEIGAPRNSSVEYQSSVNNPSVNPTEK